MSIDRERIQAHLADDTIRLFVGDFHRRHIADSNGRIVTIDDDGCGNLLGRLKLSKRSNYVSLSTFRNITGRRILILSQQRIAELVDGDTEGCQTRWMNLDSKFLLLSAEHISVGNSGDSFKGSLDVVFRELPHQSRVIAAQRERLQYWKFCREQIQFWQIDWCSPLHQRSERLLQFRMLCDKVMEVFTRRRNRFQNEPCDGGCVAVNGGDHGFPCIVRIVRHLIQLLGNSCSRISQIGAYSKLHGDCAHRVRAFALELIHPFDTLQLLFLFFDNLTFDFLSARAWPKRCDRELWLVDIRCQLHWSSEIRDRAKEHRQYHAHGQFDGVFD